MHTEPDYGEIEKVLDQLLGEGIAFSELVAELTLGENLWRLDFWTEIFGGFFREQLRLHGEIFGYVILLILSGAILSTLGKAFRGRQISDMGFYMIYLLLFLIMMRSFGECYTLTIQGIEELMAFMKVLMPAYLIAAAAAAYQTSALVFYEFFFLMIYYMQKLIIGIVMPGIRCYVLLSLLGYLGERDYLENCRKLLKKAILISMKIIIGVSSGMQMIQGMLTPAIDQMKHTVFSRSISGLGSIGNLTETVTDVLLGSGALLKNSIGAAGLILVFLISLMPALRICGFLFFYHLLSAAAEPISDKRLTAIVNCTGEGLGLLVKVLFTVGAMFMLTIAIVCVTTGGLR